VGVTDVGHRVAGGGVLAELHPPKATGGRSVYAPPPTGVRTKTGMVRSVRSSYFA
jgi:hypothetical protein